MKYCTGCGRELPDHVKFCGQCGCNSFSAAPAGDPQVTVTAAANAGDVANDAGAQNNDSAQNDAYAYNGTGVYGDETAFAGNAYDGYDYSANDAYADDGDYYSDGGYYTGRDDGYGTGEFYGQGGDTAYMDYNYDGYPGTGNYGNSGSGDGGKKPLMIAMLSLAGVLVVLCVVLVVVFFQTPKSSKRSSSKREIPAVEDAAEDPTRVEETLTAPVTAAPAPAPTYAPPASTAPATRPSTTKPTTTRPATTKPATTKPATTKPATTKPATTKPATTKPTTTTKPATTKPTTTQPAPTQPALTAPTSTQEIVALYSNAVNNVANGAAGFTVKQVRSIGDVKLVENSQINDLLKLALGEAFTPEENVGSTTYSKGDPAIGNNFPAWRLQNPAYVTAATCSVSNGYYVVQIRMQDERNPADGSPLSQVSDMINSYDEINDMVRGLLEIQGQDAGDASFDMTYSGYTIDAVITPDGRLVSMRHSDTISVTIHNLVMDVGIELDLDNKSFSWNNSKEYTNFTY